MGCVWPAGGEASRAMSIEKPVEIAAIEAALTTLLATIDREHDKYRDRRSRGFRDASTISPVEGLIDDPIGQSCRLGIRRLGERLNELDEGITQLVRAVSERVCRNKDAWADIIDKRSATGWPSQSRRSARRDVADRQDVFSRRAGGEA